MRVLSARCWSIQCIKTYAALTRRVHTCDRRPPARSRGCTSTSSWSWRDPTHRSDHSRRWRCRTGRSLQTDQQQDRSDVTGVLRSGFCLQIGQLLFYVLIQKRIIISLKPLPSADHGQLHARGVVCREFEHLLWLECCNVVLRSRNAHNKGHFFWCLWCGC